FALGFSAGVMVLVSFSELLPDSRRNLEVSFQGAAGGFITVACLLAGVLAAAAIDRLVPSIEDPPSGKRHADLSGTALRRMGLVTAIAITVHNFPEGIATFMAGYSNIKIGLPVALSIAMHNIPEGIAVAVPIYYGTGSRLKAFGYSAFSGLSEPLGALLAYLILAPLMSGVTLGIIFGAVAGIMIYISFRELIPASERYGHTVWAFAGVLSGVLAMWCALSLFGI
ncbi:MAG TPA: zinc transporter ZupT, partial [Clostridia bacterium]|nr:zinc transporter ZupT [Clostridia bacterium]